MIKYNLTCECGEKFESWFLNSSEFDLLRKKKLVKCICNSKYVKRKPKIIFDKSKPSGDKIRILNVRRSKKYGIYKKTDFQQAINETIKWYIENKSKTKLRFNYFK